MLKKLLDEKMSLAKSFYLYGLLGLLGARFIVKIFDIWLTKATNGINIVTYYKSYFNPIQADMNVVFATLFYTASILAFAYYTIAVFKLVWQSCRDFEKSLLLEFLARFFVVLWAALLSWSIF